MKTVQEFLNELTNSVELKKELLETSPDDYEAFLRKHDCEASVDEVKQLISTENLRIELTDDELNAIAAGEEVDNPKANFTACYCQNLQCSKYGILQIVQGNHLGETMTCPYCNQQKLEGTKYPWL